MKIRSWAALVAVNAMLLALNGALSVRDAYATEEGARDCCKQSVGGTGFCCDNCCWFTNDCNYSSECKNAENMT